MAGLAADGLIEIAGGEIVVPERGRPFLRNIATAFDAHLAHQDPTRPTYSTSA